ncbi:hypothetical protein L345_07139, partial [Ophiophagus hannah]
MGKRVCVYIQDRSKMEKSFDLEVNSPFQSDKSLPGGFAPRISESMAELLVNTVAGTAQMVQVSVEAQKSAQHALTQARLSYMAARGLAERLLGFLSPPDFQGLFQILSQPPMPYSEFCTIIRRTENDLADDGLQRGFPDLKFFRPCCVSKANDDGTDEEENQPVEIQDRYTSHHKKQ